MTGVVLAIPERPLAVLPRFAPVDRRQADEEPGASSGEGRPGVRVKGRALFQRVFTRRIVTDATVADDVGLCRMQVAAGRIDAQRPARITMLLPRRQAKRAAQELGYRLVVQARRRGATGEQ